MRRSTTIVFALTLALTLSVPASVLGLGGTDLPAYERLLDRLDLRQTSIEGVQRVVGDGVHDRPDRIGDITFLPDGSLWAMRRSGREKLFRVAKRGAWDAADGLQNSRQLGASTDGELLVVRNRDFIVIDGDEWTTSPRAPGVLHDFLLQDDGTVWTTVGRDLSHFDGERWTVLAPEDIDLSWSLPFEERRLGRSSGGVNGIEQTSDGAVWVGMEDRAHRPVGLARFDGTTWQEVRPFDLAEPVAILDLAAGEDGSLWARVVPDSDTERDHLARWDGETWNAWRWPSWFPSDLIEQPVMTVLPDGRAWLRWAYGGMQPMLFDGSTWSRMPLPGPDEFVFAASSAPDAAPDGTLWLTTSWKGYDKGIYIYDLDEVAPLESEAAVPFDPREG